MLRAQHGDLETDFRATLGHGFDALTESAARYLAHFEPATAVGDRILAERGRAGSSLGASPAEAETENGLTSEGSPKGDFSLPPADEFKDAHASTAALGEVQRDRDKRSARVAEEAKGWLAGKFEDFMPAMLGALQRRHLSELFAGSEPLKGDGRQIDELTQKMSADRNALLTGAPDADAHPKDMLKRGAATIATALRNFTYQKGVAGFIGRKNPEARALANLMNDATLLGLDPSEPYKRLQMKDSRGDLLDWTPQAVKQRIEAIRGQMRGRPGDDKRAMMDEVKRLRALKSREAARTKAWPEMAARWQALSPEAKSLYLQMRDWYRPPPSAR